MRGPTAALCVLVALAPACGSSSEEGGDDFSARAADAICNNIGNCCVAAGFAFEPKYCKLAARALVEVDLVDPARAAGATYDAQAAGECLNWLTEEAQACDLRDELKQCETVFVGGKPTGAACDSNIECARMADTDVACTFRLTGSGRFCTAKPNGKLGSACDSTCTDLLDGGECTGPHYSGATTTCWTNDGLYCGLSGECEPTLPIGEACSDWECVDEAFCENAICVPNKPDGAACTTNRECSERCVGKVCTRSLSDFVSKEICSGPPR